jgi:hypothetical protein
MTSKCIQSKKQNVLDSRLPRILLACWLLAGLFFLVPRHGRSQTQELHSSLDNATRTEVVEAAAKALEERYIFADVARAMAKELRAQNAAHAYDTLTSRTAFSKQLTADLYAIAHDKHIHVDSEDMRPVDLEGPARTVRAVRDRVHDRAAQAPDFVNRKVLPRQLGLRNSNAFRETSVIFVWTRCFLPTATT